MSPRTLLFFGSTMLLVAVAIPCLGGGFGGSGSVAFHADFTGVPDGPGDGEGFPTELGLLETITGDGSSFESVSPQSGIVSETLLLTDRGGAPKVSVGVHAQVAEPQLVATKLAFDVMLLRPTTTFCAEVTDTTGVDISITVRPGGVSINHNVVLNSVNILVPYRIEVTMAPLVSRPDVYVVRLLNRQTGRLAGEWTGVIPGGMDPVTGMLLMKSGESPGAVELDDIEILRWKE